MAPNARIRLGRRTEEEGVRARRGKRLGTRVVAVRRSVGYLRVVGHTLGRCRLAYAYTQYSVCSVVLGPRLRTDVRWIGAEQRSRSACVCTYSGDGLARVHRVFNEHIYTYMNTSYVHLLLTTRVYNHVDVCMCVCCIAPRGSHVSDSTG